MLQACANISPRGQYVCGKSTTAAGLTVTYIIEKKIEQEYFNN
jgi:DNA replicative helicase MCM subunit Mcm2 (Cdc46/Mcm family)